MIVHMIRTRRIPFLQSTASAPVLALTTAVIVIGMALPFSFIGSKFGFVALQPVYFAWVALTVFTYCVLTQFVKLIYMRRYARWL
jgi:Mg2+-importing ATPase